MSRKNVVTPAEKGLLNSSNKETTLRTYLKYGAINMFLIQC